MSVKGTWSRIKDQKAVDETFARMAETKRLRLEEAEDAKAIGDIKEATDVWRRVQEKMNEP